MRPKLAISMMAAMTVFLPPASAAEDSGKRLEALKAKARDAAVAVFPVLIGRQTSPGAGEVLAMILERGGMQNLDLTDMAFRPEPGTIDDSAAAFGTFLRKNPVQSDYALYAEFLTKPGAGFSEVRGILLDREGNVVWTDRQTPADKDFKKVNPGEPMECIFLVVTRLRTALGLQGPFGPELEGKIGRQWAVRTGIPTGSEKAAMQKAQEAARVRFAASRVAVFPILIGGQTDRAQAAHLAELLSTSNFGKAEVAADQPALKGTPGPNEQKRLWDMARAFREQVRRTPPAGDYALYAEYGIDPGQGRVFMVHFVVCDTAGEWVVVDFQNDHQPDFQTVAPKSAEDCDRLVIKRLASYLR